ncbi:MAG: aureocin A53 family class IId bacteriocin [Propioniciclava sp.]
MWSAILRIIARYGKRAYNWVIANRSRIMRWIRDGLALDVIIARIKQVLGIK